jgi:beta-lactamase superfamily II metal-dependent hydrolase
VSTGAAPWRARRRPRRIAHSWRQWRLEVLDPLAAGPAPGHENDASLVLVLWRGSRAAMVWTGDLEHHGETLLLDRGLLPPAAGVWKAGHHGSRTSGSRRFLHRVRPSLVVISCGLDNRHGHPSHGPYVVDGDTLGVLRTDLHGTLLIAWDRQGTAQAVFLGSDLTPSGPISSMRGRRSRPSTPLAGRQIPEASHASPAQRP